MMFWASLCIIGDDVSFYTLFQERGDGVAIIKRRCQDLHRDGVRYPVMELGRGRLKEDPESSTWRRRQDFKATLRAKNVHIFIGCFIYVVDFVILEDLGNIIDSSLSEVVLGKPFMQTSKLTYDESLRIIKFAHKDDEVVFRMPQRTKELDLVSPLEKDKFEAFFVKNLKVIFDEKKLGSS
ncbi:hypothetical protein Tco_0324949 [Tanacetum coccineum]